MEIALMGNIKSGKSSIRKVVFEKISPHECVFQTQTLNIEIIKAIMSNTNIVVKDIPGSLEVSRLASNDVSLLANSSVIIYVVDIQETGEESYEHFKEIAYSLLNSKQIALEVFLHKADGAYQLQSSNISKRRAEVQSRIKEIIGEVGYDMNIEFHNTSIYDHSLYEAFSKIFQKIIPINSIMSGLLDTLNNCCRFEKSYLFDVTSKIYMAIDSSPYEDQIYEICSDMIDVIQDMSGIYGVNQTGEENSNSTSLIKINSSTREENKKSILFLRFINQGIALISLINDENFERQHLIEYNIKLFSDAVNEIVSISSST